MCSQHKRYTLPRARCKGLGQVVDGDRGEDFGAAAPKFRLSTAPKPEPATLALGDKSDNRPLYRLHSARGRGARESAAAVPRRHDARRLARLTAASGGGVVVFQVTMLRGRRAATRSRSFVPCFLADLRRGVHQLAPRRR